MDKSATDLRQSDLNPSKDEEEKEEKGRAQTATLADAKKRRKA